MLEGSWVFIRRGISMVADALVGYIYRILINLPATTL